MKIFSLIRPVVGVRNSMMRSWNNATGIGKIEG